jgi:hypothetical protein
VRIVPLAPDHIGLTIRDQPILYWYLSTTLAEPVDVTISVLGEPRSMFEVRLVPPLEPGIYAVNLRDFGVRLAPKLEYVWALTVKGYPGGKEFIATGAMLKVPVPDELESELLRAKKRDIPRLLAQHGMWYDSMTSISELLAESPTDRVLLDQRASLLEQIGLMEVAGLDREGKLPLH